MHEYWRPKLSDDLHAPPPDAGLGDRIALAQEVCLRHELSSFGGQGYAHILANIVPRMLESGVP